VHVIVLLRALTAGIDLRIIDARRGKPSHAAAWRKRRRATVIWRRVLVLAAASFATMGLASTAFASEPATGTGGFVPAGPPVTISTRSADGNPIVTQIQQFTDTGVISGTETDTVTFTFHADGTFNLRADVAFTGMVAGRPGTLTQRFQGTGNPGCFQGQLETLGGTADLANLHGQGTFVGSTATGVGTYVFNYHFDP
jgi:hypothetical protein